jgi:hypothetical protein
MKAEEAVTSIIHEYGKACKKFPEFNSAHEGYAVIKEELDELWDEIKKNPADADLMKKEACQLGAMALRFMTDICFGMEGDQP